MVSPGIRISPRLWKLAAPMALAFAVLMALAALSMAVFSAGYAYIHGEGLWSKAQKDAVYSLLRYSRSGDEADFAAYRASIAVPLGDRAAREALELPEPDFEAARAGLLKGRNHPSDVRAMSQLFVYFRHVRYMDDAIAIWAQADGLVAQLEAAADRLHEAVQAQPRDAARVSAIVGEIDSLSHRLQPLEDRFSNTLAEAIRKLKSAAVGVRWAAGISFVLWIGFLLN